MATKPGYRTTEFWLTLVSVLVGAVLASGSITHAPTLQALGFVASLLASLGYAGARSWVKTTDAKAAAVASLPTRPQ